MSNACWLLIFSPILCAGKREFDSLVSFIETGEFEYEEYPPEEHDEDELEVFGDDGDFGHDELWELQHFVFVCTFRLLSSVSA